MKLLNEDSAISRLPQNLDVNQAFLIDGLRYSAKIIELAYDNLQKELLEVSLNSELEKPTRTEYQFYSVFQSAWAIIDFTTKMENILKRMNVQFIPVVATFFANCRNMRNTFQHLDERIQHFMDSGIPFIWGIIKWIHVIDDSKVLSCIMASGHTRNTTISALNPLNYEIDETISAITLCSVNSKSEIAEINFNKHMKALESVLSQMEDMIGEQVPVGSKKHAQDLTAFIGMTVNTKVDK